MSYLDKDLVIPKNLTDYCDVRRKVALLIEQGHRAIQEADNELETVVRYGLGHGAEPRSSVIETMQEVDRRLWRSAFDLTGFNQVMDTKARNDFEKSLEREPPEFNEKNVRSIFVSAAQDADTMFARGLVEIFLHLSKRLKTNQKCAFKVERKVIMGFMITTGYRGGLRVNYGQESKLNDIDRVIKVLDGKQYHPRALETAINGALESGETNVFEDDYYKIRGFRNGNMHIEFKRADLLEKANKVISDYYDGQALAAA